MRRHGKALRHLQSPTPETRVSLGIGQAAHHSGGQPPRVRRIAGGENSVPTTFEPIRYPSYRESGCRDAPAASFNADLSEGLRPHGRHHKQVAFVKKSVSL